MNWEVKRIFAHTNSFVPSIPKGWEPFGIQWEEGGCYIWLRKEVEEEAKDDTDRCGDNESSQ